MNHLCCSWGFSWVDKAQSFDRLPGVPLVRARTFQCFSRHLASRYLSRNTLLICLMIKPSKLFQIIQHYSTTTYSTLVFQMFSALKTVSGNAACRRSGISVMSRTYLDIRNFFGTWRKSLNFGVFATLNLKFSGELPQTPAKCNPPFLIPWLRACGWSIFKQNTWLLFKHKVQDQVV